MTKKTGRIFVLVVVIVCTSLWIFTRYLSSKYGANRTPPVSISALILDLDEMHPIWHLNYGPKKIPRGDIYDVTYPNLEVSFSIEKDSGYFLQKVYQCGNPAGAIIAYYDMLSQPLDREWLKDYHIDLPNIHADAWEFGCEEIEGGQACEGAFRYQEYLIYVFLNPPSEYMDLQEIIDTVYMLDQKVSRQLKR